MLSVLRPKFSGLLGEALDVAARWSGDVVSTSFLSLFFFWIRGDVACVYVFTCIFVGVIWSFLVLTFLQQ